LFNGKAKIILPEDNSEEIREILKKCRQPKSNLTTAEWRDFRSLKANGLLTVVPAEKGNAAVVLGTSDYNRKIATILEDKAYMKLKRDPTNAIE
jgi:hypothetical protein